LRLGLDNLDDFLRRAEQPPLLVEVSACELVVELIQDAVDLHAVVDLLLQLLDCDGDLSDELPGLCQIFNVLGWPSDSLVDFIELGGQRVVELLGLLCDELDFLLDDA
jgi:hypothetical protein